MPDASESVAAYVAALDDAHLALFERLQALVLDVVPDAEVRISYQIPIYKVGRRHVGLNAGLRDGVTLTTTSPDHIAAFVARHPGFKTGKASIQVRFDDVLPEEDIREVVRRATTA
ncbi:MAG: DUF1801 domain-containing protein [Acidimicrobiales bacterium]|nr:DUF1801 domain-containing protein [Acidimicrobiales bacterium]